MGEAKRHQGLQTYRHATSACPQCGKVLDAATPTRLEDKRAPEPGDISVCLHCHGLLVYGDDMSLREPTDDEIVELAGDPELVWAMTLIRDFKMEKGRT